MSNIQLIFDKINRSIVNDVDIQRVISVLQSGFLSKPDGGPSVAEFQQLMAKLHDKRYAFAVNSGTSALHCAIVALALQKGRCRDAYQVLRRHDNEGLHKWRS